MNILNFSTAHLKQNLLTALMLGLTAMLAPLSAMAEPGIATTREGNAIAPALEQRGFTATFAREIERILSENRALIARGELPNTPEYTFTIEFVAPIRDAQGMEALVAGGSALPRMDEKALGLPAVLDESTLEATLDRLFDASDIDAWIHKEDGSVMTAKEKEAYREVLAREKKRGLKHFDKLKAQPNGADAIATFFLVYNEGRQAITYPSRESYRHLFIASFSIASFLASSPEEQSKLAPTALSQVGEYMLLTDPRADSLFRLRFNPYDFLVPSARAVGNHSILKKLPAIGELQGMTDVALVGFKSKSERVTKNGKLNVEVAQKEGQLAKNDARAKLKDDAKNFVLEIIKLVKADFNDEVRHQLAEKVSGMRVIHQQLLKGATQQEVAQLEDDEKWLKTVEALAQKEGQLAQKEGQLAQIKEETAQIQNLGRIADEFERISQATLELITAYKTNPTIKLKKKIDANISAMQALQRQAQIYSGSEILAKSCKSCLELIANIEKLIRAHQFVYSQVE